MMYRLHFIQKLPLSLQESWNFFSTPTNLKLLTPDHLNLEIDDLPIPMYAGQIFAYRIRPIWNLSLEWISEITHIQEPHYFIDEQRFGPYKFWHHEHRFASISKGVEMQDIVLYKLPLGLLGRALHMLKVKKDLEAIFAYRQDKLVKLFGHYTG